MTWWVGRSDDHRPSGKALDGRAGARQEQRRCRTGRRAPAYLTTYIAEGRFLSSSGVGSALRLPENLPCAADGRSVVADEPDAQLLGDPTRSCLRQQTDGGCADRPPRPNITHE